ATQPPSPAAIDVSTGLLCVISEIGGKNQRWLKWLEVAPLDPASYIQAAASYDAAAQRIVLNFAPSGKRDDGEPDLPDDLMQKPLEIQWDSLDEQLSQARRNERGRFDGRNAKIVLTADAPTDNIRKPELRVHVDGYPRAFVFEVPLVADKPAIDRRRSRESIHLDSLRVLNDPKSTRVFVFPEVPPVGEPIVERNEETKIERVKLPATAPATFLVPRTPLELTFHVDAPLDAFTLDRDDDAIELRFDAQESAPLTFFSDRQSFMRLKEAGPDGLVLESELHDYVVPLYPEGLTDGDFQLAARLRLAQSADGDSRPHAVRVVFDSRAPEIKYVRPTPDLVQPIPQGSVVRLQLDIADRSGIDNAEFQLLDSADKVPFSRKFAASWFAGPGPWNLNLELKDVPPGEYRWRLVATDKVGLSSTFDPKRLVIAPPQPAAEKKASIQGYVFKGTLRPPRFTVRIDGLDIPPVMTNEKGEFRFNDVPKDGKFKVIARGTISGVMHEGMIEAAASENPRTMPIELKKAGN
ncbi:MAG TPA: hypothetical protein PLV92_20470, partial [Pirellulaceae bacterium]|nr:hypothetical protein [Pirellulaceae bacterium]